MLRYFWPILTPPVTLCHTFWDPKKYITHLGSPPIFSMSSTKNPDKSPCTNSLSIVRGVFVQGVLSGVVFVHFPFCQNTSVTTER